MTVDTLHWFPLHIQNMDAFKEVAKAYDYLLKIAADDISIVLDNQFLDTLTEEGVALRERILGIVPGPTDSLEERRQRIKGYYASDLPYTENKLDDVLSAMCGPDNYSLDVDGSTYSIVVKIKLNAINLVNNVYDVLYRMKPSNMMLTVILMYNRHEILALYPHCVLAFYTQGELRNKVLEMNDLCDNVANFTCGDIYNKGYTWEIMDTIGIRKVV